MSAILPRILKNFTVVLDGDQTAGVITEISPPKLKRKQEDYRGGGMSGTVAVDLGMEKLETSFTLAEWNDNLIRHFADCDVNGIPVRFLGYQERDDGSCFFDRIEMVMRGRWSEIDFGSAKAGDKNEIKTTMPLAYFRYILNGVDQIELEPIAMLEKIAGKDRLAVRRLALEII